VTPDGLLLVLRLQNLKRGDRVYYRDWRGGKGEGTFLRHVDAVGNPIDSKYWGGNKKHGLVVKRDASADEGRVFRPLLQGGDYVLTGEMIVQNVMES
jgi:hypothetical protein